MWFTPTKEIVSTTDKFLYSPNALSLFREIGPFPNPSTLKACNVEPFTLQLCPRSSCKCNCNFSLVFTLIRSSHNDEKPSITVN